MKNPRKVSLLLVKRGNPQMTSWTLLAESFWRKLKSITYCVCLLALSNTLLGLLSDVLSCVAGSIEVAVEVWECIHLCLTNLTENVSEFALKRFLASFALLLIKLIINPLSRWKA